jgi:hypothetical protein
MVVPWLLDIREPGHTALANRGKRKLREEFLEKIPSLMKKLKI